MVHAAGRVPGGAGELMLSMCITISGSLCNGVHTYAVLLPCLYHVFALSAWSYTEHLAWLCTMRKLTRRSIA